MNSDKPVDRRRFFREGLRELLKPLVQAIEPIEQAVRQLDNFDNLGSEDRRLPSNVWLRPPGALTPDINFRKSCQSCQECVRVCPAQCIKIDSTKSIAHGAPYIDANVMACVVCDGLKCMHACPTGALVPTALAEIDMGTAVWYADTCVRSRGEDCTICIDHCPLGTVAIELKANRVHVHPNGCTGCGVCQHDCPTEPKSIVVIPRMARESTNPRG